MTISKAIDPARVGLTMNQSRAAWDKLFLGTNSDNQRDASRKGRKPTGDNHVGHRLSADQVLAIRTSAGNQRQVAERFGVSQSLVSRIRSGDRRVTA